MTVAALMMTALDFQFFQTIPSQAHRNRSAGVSLGRFTERCGTPIWCRSARIFQIESAARLPNEAESEAIPSGVPVKSDNPQFINLIEVFENHTPFANIFGAAAT
jgi:hypothetical protein